MKVYVAGPYSAPTHDERSRNTVNAMDAGIELLQKGHTPYVPHLSHFLNERAKDQGIEVSYDTWMEFDERWLYDCAALLYLAPSPGADQEREVAEQLGMNVYETVDAVPDATIMDTTALIDENRELIAAALREAKHQPSYAEDRGLLEQLAQEIEDGE